MKHKSNERINRLSTLLAYMLDIQKKSARVIVNHTEIGRALKEDNMTVLYDQDTANMIEIIDELSKRKHYGKKLQNTTINDVVRIAKSAEYKEISNKTRFKTPKRPELKEIQRQSLLQRMKEINQNERMIRNAFRDEK